MSSRRRSSASNDEPKIAKIPHIFIYSFSLLYVYTASIKRRYAVCRLEYSYRVPCTVLLLMGKKKNDASLFSSPSSVYLIGISSSYYFLLLLCQQNNHQPFSFEFRGSRKSAYARGMNKNVLLCSGIPL